MRATLVLLAGLIITSPDAAFAQAKKAQPAQNTLETRYFTSIDGLMDGNADVVLKETRLGKTVTAAELDVCYPVDKSTDRKDRFVVNLTVSGQTLSGTTQSIGDKQPVTVKLTRKPNGNAFDFRGQITIGQKVTEVASSDNSDVSEKEYKESLPDDDGIMPAPKDYSEFSPDAVAVRMKLDVATEFLKGLKGQEAEISLASLAITCDELRANEQTINMTVDPERAVALVAKARAMPGVIAAGWTSGTMDLDRTIRFPGAPWREGDRINRDKLASTISAVLAKSLNAKPASSNWNPVTGKLKLTFKRPSRYYPALDLVDTIEVIAMVSPDNPGGGDKLLLWINSPVATTADEGQGARLSLSAPSTSEEEADYVDDSGSVEALAAEFKAQRWNSDKSEWK